MNPILTYTTEIYVKQSVVIRGRDNKLAVPGSSSYNILSRIMILFYMNSEFEFNVVFLKTLSLILVVYLVTITGELYFLYGQK